MNDKQAVQCFRNDLCSRRGVGLWSACRSRLYKCIDYCMMRPAGDTRTTYLSAGLRPRGASAPVTG